MCPNTVCLCQFTTKQGDTMAGNDGRRGAVRKPGSKKGPKVGTGGHSRRRLEGKGPTPKAEDRTYHPAFKRKKAREAREAQEAAIARARAKCPSNVSLSLTT